MNMTKEALEYLVRLGEIEILDIDGQKYTSKQINHIKYPSPAPITVTTLTGLVDYIRTNIDALDIKELLIHVCGPREVKLISCICDDYSRDIYIHAVAQLPQITFGQFMPIEAFNIMLQSGFEPTEDKDRVLRIVGNITEENVKSTGDDGISQKVTARVGIVKEQDIEVPNPIILSPYRTFLEISQPASNFILRMQNGPMAALFEADGGAWKSCAMQGIKKYLENEFKDTEISIIS